ncbi:hypothetical protein E5Z02_24250, partial [Streptomyces rhizosphaericola]
MSSDPSGAAEQEPVGGFITEPLVVAAATTGGCCGEPADATGAVPGGQGGAVDRGLAARGRRRARGDRGGLPQ